MRGRSNERAALRAPFIIAALVTAGLIAPATRARAQEEEAAPKVAQLASRHANFAWDKSLLRASFSFRDVLDPALTEKLSTGLPTTILMRAYVLQDGQNEPVALAARTCQVTYDLWDEVYRIKMSGPGGERNTAAINVEGVQRLCTEARDLPIIDRAILKAGKPHLLGVIVDVNPISPQMLEQIRRWVARPSGAAAIGPGDALFGSFVGLFLRQIGTSDRTLRFRTQTFTP